MKSTPALFVSGFQITTGYPDQFAKLDCLINTYKDSGKTLTGLVFE
jgi:hypothetical protein